MPKYYLSRLPGSFNLISTKRKDLLLKTILNCLLSDGLFSITQEPDGSCSILLQQFRDGDDFKRVLVSGESYLCPERYRAFQINTENPGLDEPGMLAEITGFLGKYEIPILCLSTFNCNYLYYPTNVEDRITAALGAAPETFLLD